VNVRLLGLDFADLEVAVAAALIARVAGTVCGCRAQRSAALRLAPYAALGDAVTTVTPRRA
jgi:hypothetical protein